MMNTRARLLIAFFGLLAAAPCTQAAVLSLGTFSNTNYLVGVDNAGSFTDFYKFQLNGSSDVTGAFAPFFGVSNFGWTLDQYKGGTYTPLTGSNGSFSNLSSGPYEFVFDGTVTPFPLGAYIGSYSVTAVPEPDTWLMLLIGAGLLAYQLRRKQRSLATFTDGLSGLGA